MALLGAIYHCRFTHVPTIHVNNSFQPTDPGTHKLDTQPTGNETYRFRILEFGYNYHMSFAIRRSAGFL